jgi:hypothetical protein
MEIHLGLLPYPKENDTSEEVSLFVRKVHLGDFQKNEDFV